MGVVVRCNDVEVVIGKNNHAFRHGSVHNVHLVLVVHKPQLRLTFHRFMQEIELALDHHELVKIKLPTNSKTEKVALLAQITGSSNSEPVQLIGRVGVIYRATEEPKITLPSV